MTIFRFTIRLRAVLCALVAAMALTACSTSSNTPLDPVDHTPGLVLPGSVHVDPAADPARTASMVRIAQRLYTFWDTGNTALLEQVLAPTFVDRTLPAGRPQGPAGPAAASTAFRAAVPDLRCDLVDLYVTGDTLTAHLVFSGHFTGTYQGTRGAGQDVRFTAIDIQHVGAGDRITEDWHLEDNLTFLQQIGRFAKG